MGKSEKMNLQRHRIQAFFMDLSILKHQSTQELEEFIFKNYYWYFTNKIFTDNFTFTRCLHTSEEGTQHRRSLQSKDDTPGNPLEVQQLGLGASTAGGMNSIPGQGTKIPQASKHAKQTNKKR